MLQPSIVISRARQLIIISRVDFRLLQCLHQLSPVTMGTRHSGQECTITKKTLRCMMTNTTQARTNTESIIKWDICRTDINTLRTAPITNGPLLDLNTTTSRVESIARTQGTETIGTLWDTGPTRTRICSFRTRAQV